MLNLEQLYYYELHFWCLTLKGRGYFTNEKDEGSPGYLGS